MDDDALVAALRDAARRHDPAPPAAAATARDAFGLRVLDAELAALVEDGADAAPEAVGVRAAAAAARLLVFAVDDVEVELEVTEIGQRRGLVGQVHADGGAVVAVDVQTPTSTSPAPLDERGRFVLDDVPAGPVRLRCVLGGGQQVVTAWVVV